MLRRSLQIGLLLALVVLSAAASAPAQTLATMGAYRAHIPFEFVVGSDRYPAGDYKIRMERLVDPNTVGLMTINDPTGELLYKSFVFRNGNASADDRTTLHFDRYGRNQYTYVLRQVVSPEFGFTVRSPKTETWVNITEDIREKPEAVVVALTVYN